MRDKTMIPTHITCSLLSGTTFFVIGLVIDDLYTVIAGASLLLIYTITATGEKIIQALPTRPKGL